MPYFRSRENEPYNIDVLLLSTEYRLTYNLEQASDMCMSKTRIADSSVKLLTRRNTPPRANMRRYL